MVRRTNRARRRRGGEDEDGEGRSWQRDRDARSYAMELLRAEEERLDDLQVMLDFLEKNATSDSYDDLSEKERHEYEEELVVDILSQLHPNLTVSFERDMDSLLAGAGGEDGAEEEGGDGDTGRVPHEAAEGDFIEAYKAEFMEMLGVDSEEEWKEVSAMALEDVEVARKKVARHFPHLVHSRRARAEPGRQREALELDEMANLVSSDDPLKDHMVKAMALLKQNSGWNHQDRKKYLKELMDRT